MYYSMYNDVKFERVIRFMKLPVIYVNLRDTYELVYIYYVDISTMTVSVFRRTGSIERLEDGDKRVIASHHLLPEDNINVVVRYLHIFTYKNQST